MPRASAGRAVLNRLDELHVSAAKHLGTQRPHGLPTADSEPLFCRIGEPRQRVQSNGHLIRPPHRRRTPKFHLRLETDHGDSIADEEFKTFFRMTRDCFWQLVQLLEGHGALHRKTSDTRGQDPKPAPHQMLVLLRHCGCEGSAASSIALGNFFGVGSGSIDSCRRGALEALLASEGQTCFWPDSSERKQIAGRTEDKWSWPNCVGLMDGTLLPLSSRPVVHGQMHLSRKKLCAIVVLVACDDVGRILHCHVGWPGSAHDNRVWRNCSLFESHQEFFSNQQCLPGGSAFTASAVMTPPCKALPGHSLPSDRTEFNTLLAKPRVKSEHCIGIFKGCLPFLESIRLETMGKKSMKRLADCARGGVALHNLLIEGPPDDDWMDEDDEEGADDLTPEMNKASNAPDCSRREALCCCLSEPGEANTT